MKRKLNLLTIKYRPKCAFGESIVGFRWYTNGEQYLSETAYHNKNYSGSMENFREETLPEEIWNQL